MPVWRNVATFGLCGECFEDVEGKRLCLSCFSARRQTKRSDEGRCRPCARRLEQGVEANVKCRRCRETLWSDSSVDGLCVGCKGFLHSQSKCVQCFRARRRPEPEYQDRCSACARKLESRAAPVPQPEDDEDPPTCRLIGPFADVMISTGLPAYDTSPVYIDPEHCRLCLTRCRSFGGEFCQSAGHGASTTFTARERVFCSVSATCPQPVESQTWRCRLQALRDGTSAENFHLEACAACAREKRQAKMIPFTFPVLTQTVFN